MIRFLWLDKNKLERAFKIQSMYICNDWLSFLTYLLMQRCMKFSSRLISQLWQKTKGGLRAHLGKLVPKRDYRFCFWCHIIILFKKYLMHFIRGITWKWKKFEVLDWAYMYQNFLSGFFFWPNSKYETPNLFGRVSWKIKQQKASS